MITQIEIDTARGDLYRHLPSQWRQAMLSFVETAEKYPRAGESLLPMVRQEIAARRMLLVKLIKSGHVH